MVDRVQPLKIESPDTGGTDVDSFPTGVNVHQDYLECAGVALQDVAHRDETTLVFRDDLDMKFKDGNNPVPVTLTDLLAGGGGGITPTQHEALRTLTHEIVENSWDEITRDINRRIIQVTTWTSQSLPRFKIRDTFLTRGAGNRVSQVLTIQYDVTGAEVYRITEDLSRNVNHLIVAVTRTRAA